MKLTPDFSKNIRNSNTNNNSNSFTSSSVFPNCVLSFKRPLPLARQEMKYWDWESMLENTNVCARDRGLHKQKNQTNNFLLLLTLTKQLKKLRHKHGSGLVASVHLIVLPVCKVHRILKVAHYFVFRNQNKWFVNWRAGLDRKQEVNVNKCILIKKRPSLFLEGYM